LLNKLNIFRPINNIFKKRLCLNSIIIPKMSKYQVHSKIGEGHYLFATDCLNRNCVQLNENDFTNPTDAATTDHGDKLNKVES